MISACSIRNRARRWARNCPEAVSHPHTDSARACMRRPCRISLAARSGGELDGGFMLCCTQPASYGWFSARSAQRVCRPHVHAKEELRKNVTRNDYMRQTKVGIGVLVAGEELPRAALWIRMRVGRLSVFEPTRAEACDAFSRAGAVRTYGDEGREGDCSLIRRLACRTRSSSVGSPKPSCRYRSISFLLLGSSSRERSQASLASGL